jgi:hypothetical protein
MSVPGANGLDITQIQARSDDQAEAQNVAWHLTKYMSKFEHVEDWLPKGRQLVTGSRGSYAWTHKTRLQIRKERIQNALALRQNLEPTSATSTGAS